MRVIAELEPGASPSGAPTYDINSLRVATVPRGDFATLLDRLTATFEGGGMTALQRARLQQFYFGLLNDGILAKTDVLQGGLASGADSLINWKGEGIDATNNGATFADGMFEFNGTSSYIDTGFRPSTEAVNWTLDSAAFAVYVHEAADGSTPLFGGSVNNANAEFRFTVAGPTATARINSSTPTSGVSTTAQGVWVVNRAGNTVQVFKNGEKLLEETIATTGLLAANVQAGRSGTTAYRQAKIGPYAFMGGLTEDEVGDVTERFRSFVGY